MKKKGSIVSCEPYGDMTIKIIAEDEIGNRYVQISPVGMEISPGSKCKIDGNGYVSYPLKK